MKIKNKSINFTIFCKYLKFFESLQKKLYIKFVKNKINKYNLLQYFDFYIFYQSLIIQYNKKLIKRYKLNDIP